MLGIVILNYLNWWDTVELIETIRKQTFKDYYVVIVDNCSQNGSVEKLEELYSVEEKIHLLEASSNEGFARGNNIGIYYAINDLNVQDVFLLNNDTLLLDKNYLENLANIKYGKTVGAVGTKILDANGKNQNPVYGVHSLREACLGLLRNTFLYKLCRPSLKYLKHLFVNFKMSITRKKIRTETNSKIEEGSSILHGSAVLLTKNYLEQYPGLYPETFMFFEENILDFLLKKNSLRAEYYDQISIKHKEDQSSTLAFDDITTRKQKMLVNSWGKYLKLRCMSRKRIKRHFSVHCTDSTVKF